MESSNKRINHQKQKLKQVLLRLATMQIIKSKRKNISERGILLKTNYKFLELEMDLAQDSIRKYLIRLKNDKFIEKRRVMVGRGNLLIYILNKEDIDSINRFLKNRKQKIF